VVGQLRQVRPRIGGVDALQRLPHASVQAHPPCCRQALVQHLADQRVRKPPAAKPTRYRSDHPGRLGLLQQPQQLVGVQATSRVHGRQLKLAAEDGSDLQYPPAVVREPAEPLGDHRLDALWQPRRPPHPGRVEAALAGQQPHHLGDKKRVAVGLLMHGRHQLR
jgi:hypothetical protein